ncbi:MAG: protein kinase family protein [Actinomycetota bacterium]|nr:protein kinase family protein [Actinomycetota bacterium]
MGSHLVEPGAVLADRYVVEDLLAEEGASSSWRARDKILARSVVLQVLPSSAPQAAAMVRAAKHASRVADPRLLQVLDAVDDGELSYVVREWATGQSLNVLLAEGPLSARRAAWLVSEVAAAMCTAHLNDVPHRRLAPDTVVVTTSSGVKVVGLGTFGALRDEPDDEIPGELHDTRDLGRLLYSCLTARWPGSAVAGLPAAPTEHGRVLRPRQVRAGVPRSLDAVCDRILSDSSRYGAPITTVAEVRDELTQILSAEGFPTGVGAITATAASDSVAQRPVDLPPALLPRDAGPPPGEQPRYAARTSQRRRASPLRRSLMFGVVAVLIAGIVLLAYRVGQRDLNEPGASADVPASPRATRDEAKPLVIESAVSFDPPPGSGDEQPDLVPFATDGDVNTSWETVTYDDQLGPTLPALKEGVGLVLDLGRVQAVREVQLTMPAPGADLDIRTAPTTATTAPQSSVDQYPLQKRVADAQQESRIVLDEPVRTRFVLVWLTKLPPEATGGFQGAISEVQVLG